MIKQRVTTLPALLLLTASLLSACGSVNPPADTAAQSLPSSFKYLHTLSMAPNVSEADLQQRYGGSVVGYYPEEGRAVIATHSANLEGNALGVQDLSTELNTKSYAITEQGMGIWSTGFGAWSTGYGAWSTGYGAWSTGKLADSAAAASTTFKDNLPFWNMIKLSEAQSIAPQLGAGVTVAVIDTGIDLNHPSFKGKLDLTNAKDYIDGDARPQDVDGDTTSAFSAGYGHGTSVASLILQMAPNATILPIRVLGPDGGGDTATVVSAINYAVSKGVDIINLSLGSSTASAALDSAVQYAVSKGVAVVCAAGNTGTTSMVYPARSAKGSTSQGSGSISVGSVNGKFLKSSFSSYGRNLELTAPGEGLTAAFPGNRYSKVSGTSFAAPVVSGVLALGTSTRAPNTTASQVADMLIDVDATATPPSDPNYSATLLGNGTLNAYKYIYEYR